MIDDLIADVWPQELKELLGTVEQGDAVFGDLPMQFLTRRSTAATSLGCALAVEYDREAVEVPANLAPDAWVITDDTCDICEEANIDTPHKPFVLLAPAYRNPAISSGASFDIDCMGVTYLMRLTGAEFADIPWLVDLRYRQSLDKGALLGTRIVKGFATDDVRRFAERLSFIPIRPVFDQKIVDAVIEPLRKLCKKRGRTGQLITARVDQIRLRVSDAQAQLVVVLQKGGDSALAREALETWYTESNKRCRDIGIDLLGMIVNEPKGITADYILDSQRLMIPALAPENRPRRSADDTAPEALQGDNAL